MSRLPLKQPYPDRQLCMTMPGLVHITKVFMRPSQQHIFLTMPLFSHDLGPSCMASHRLLSHHSCLCVSHCRPLSHCFQIIHAIDPILMQSFDSHEPWSRNLLHWLLVFSQGVVGSHLHHSFLLRNILFDIDFLSHSMWNKHSKLVEMGRKLLFDIQWPSNLEESGVQPLLFDGLTLKLANLHWCGCFEKFECTAEVTCSKVSKSASRWGEWPWCWMLVSWKILSAKKSKMKMSLAQTNLNKAHWEHDF